MASPAERYAQVSETLVNHPKTTRVCRALKIHRLMFVGHMTCFWNWAMKNAPDGNLSRFSARDIADASLYTDPDKYDDDEEERACEFVQALQNCHVNQNGSGFLETTEQGLRIHDWDQYGGKFYEKRLRNAQKVAEWRANQVTPEPCNGYVTVTSTPHTEPVTVTPLEEKQREAKRREAEQREEKNTSGADAPAASGDTRKPKSGKPENGKEVADYFVECGSTKAIAREFWDFYLSKGWLVGKSPMKDWRAAARNWIRANYTRGAPNSQSAIPADAMEDEEETAAEQLERDRDEQAFLEERRARAKAALVGAPPLEMEGLWHAAN